MNLARCALRLEHRSPFLPYGLFRGERVPRKVAEPSQGRQTQDLLSQESPSSNLVLNTARFSVADACQTISRPGIC